MSFGRFRRLVVGISGLGSRNESNLYSTKVFPRRKGLSGELYSRISPVRDQNISIVPILDQWIQQGRSVDEQTLKDIIEQLRHSKQFTHALQISIWMTDRRHFDLTPSDAAIRLQLISKAHGIEQAEAYFNTLSEMHKGVQVYCALLKCYSTSLCVERAEALMQNMRDLGYAKRPAEYNFMLSLYHKTENVDKFNALLKEMARNGVVHNRLTFGIQLSMYAADMDIEGIDEIVMMMESNPKIAPDWNDFNVAATGYRKAGLLDKAFEMLKKAEACLTTKPDITAYNSLLTQYANIGRKDEVLRVWSLYKKKCRVNNKGYRCVLMSLVKLDNIEMAEEIFDEWEYVTGPLGYDINIPNVMICSYSRKGLSEKAEALLDRAISKGGKPNAWTWQHFVEGYLQNQQPQKAVETMKKALAVSETGWKPDMALFKACLEYLEGVGDIEKSEAFANLLQGMPSINKSMAKLNNELYRPRSECLNCSSYGYAGRRRSVD